MSTGIGLDRMKVEWLIEKPEIEPWTVLGLGALSVIVLFGVVPTLHLLSGISLLVLTAVALPSLLVFFIVANRLVEGTIAAALIFATVRAGFPLIRSSTPLSPLEVRLADPFVGLLVVLLAIWYVQGAWDPPRGLWVIGLGALWVGWTGLAAIFGAGPDSAAAAFFAVDQARLMLYFAVGICLMTLISLRTAIVTIAIAGIGHTFVALAQTLYLEAGTLSDLGGTDPVFAHLYVDPIEIGPLSFETGAHLGGLAGPSTAFASVALLSLAVCWYYAGRGPLRQRLLAASIIPLLLLPLFLSLSDTIHISTPLVIIGASCVLAWPYVPDHIRQWIVRMRRELAATAVVSGVSAVVLSLVIDIESLLGVDSFYSRLETYGAAVAVAQDYPLFGVGGANFLFVAESYGGVEETPAHSIFFEYLASTGVIGVALFLVVIGVVGWYTAKALNDPRSDQEMVGIVCVWLGAFTLLAMLNLVWPRPSSMGTFWFIAGMLVATGSAVSTLR